MLFWTTQDTFTAEDYLDLILYISICLWNSLKANVIVFVNEFIEVYNFFFTESKNNIRVILWFDNDVLLY